MFSLRTRIAIVVLVTAYAVYQLANGDRSAYVLLAGAAFIGLGYFRYGPVRPAFMAARHDDFDTARRHLGSIRFPNLLSPQSRAYWHWTNAILAAQDPSQIDSAEDEMRQGVGGALRTSHDRCLATATLAELVTRQGRIEEALGLLAEAERFPHRDTAEDYLNELRSDLGNREDACDSMP